MKLPSLKFYLAVSVVLGLFAACGSDPSADSDLAHLPGATDECTKDEDCDESEPICDELAGCVACQFDKDCDEDERCHKRACVPSKSCTSNAECTTEQPVCDLLAGRCAVCLADADCGTDARCVDETCEDVVRCVNSRGCSEDAVCDIERSFCVECVSDVDCGEEQACVDNVCKPQCASDKDCAAEGLLCDPVAAHCVDCLRDVDCPEVYYCAGGKCHPDICDAGDTHCSPANSALGTNEFFTCNETGSGYLVNYCQPQSTCKQFESARCEPWLCSPGLSECANVDTLSACAPDGLSAAKIDCSAMDGACEPNSAACVDVVCTPNERQCANGTSMVCNPRGTALSVSEVCAETSYCSGKTGRCEADVCTAGVTLCDGDVVKICKDEGDGYSEIEDCEESDGVCRDGACKPIICEGTYHCHDGDVYSCVDGLSRTLADNCADGQVCLGKDAGAACFTITCSAGTDTCMGSFAGTCNETGTGLIDGGIDCSETDQACFAGECLDIVCEGARICDEERNVRTCLDNGTRIGEIWDDCEESEYCRELPYENGSCVPDVCTPGQLSCGNGDISRCVPDGSAYELFEECPTDQTCVLGTCLPVICQANAFYCLSGNVYRCGGDGTTNQLYDTCSANEHCKAGSSVCTPDVCSASSAICNGANVAVCAADGSGPTDAGTACPTGQICASGACAAVVCEPGSYRCSDSMSQLCNATGTAWGNALSCSASQFCDDSKLPSPPVCTLDLCVAGQPTCDGEKLATCGTFGGSFTAQGTDCSLTDQVCNKSACVSIEELVLAESALSSSTSTTRTYLNRFSVRTARHLTEIEQYFAASGTSQFTFYVYRSLSPEAYFERVLEKLVTATPTASGSYVSSGAIDVTLEPGYYYAIGVRTTGSYNYYNQSSADTFESFARFDGGYQTSTTPGPTLYISKSTTVYRQRLSLEPAP